jgi:hypothetical protein
MIQNDEGIVPLKALVSQMSRQDGYFKHRPEG